MIEIDTQRSEQVCVRTGIDVLEGRILPSKQSSRRFSIGLEQVNSGIARIRGTGKLQPQPAKSHGNEPKGSKNLIHKQNDESVVVVAPWSSDVDYLVEEPAKNPRARKSCLRQSRRDGTRSRRVVSFKPPSQNLPTVLLGTSANSVQEDIDRQDKARPTEDSSQLSELRKRLSIEEGKTFLNGTESGVDDCTNPMMQISVSEFQTLKEPHQACSNKLEKHHAPPQDQEEYIRQLKQEIRKLKWKEHMMKHPTAKQHIAECLFSQRGLFLMICSLAWMHIYLRY